MRVVTTRITVAALLALALGACGTRGPVDQLRQVAGEGTPEERVARLEKAAATDKKLRGELYRQRELAIAKLIYDGDQLRRQGKTEDAQALYQRAARLDPENARARDALRQIDMAKRHAQVLAEAEKLLKTGDLRGAGDKAAEVLRENPNQREARALARRVAEAQLAARETVIPQLNASLAKPITLEFRDATLGSVFDLISRTAGVNFVFDRDVRADSKVNIHVRNTSIEDAIKIILLTNQLERKVLNENTVLVYPNTPAKAKDYQDLVVRSFYLGNSDPKQVLAMLKTIIRARDVYIDEKLNLLVMRDTPQAVRLAEKLVMNQDLAEPEVMLEVEVLEIAQIKDENLGVRLPSDTISIGNPTSGVTTIPLTSGGLSSIRAFVSNPALVANLKQQSGSTRVLANPSIRVKNREKAKIHVGEKVPVITTTSTANVGVSSSISYLDTGLKLEVEPNVYLDDDIGIKVSLEVSSLGNQVESNGTIAFRVNTRTAGTALRLRDGETQVLAGLINDADRVTTNKLPGLGSLPVLGRLFSNRNENGEKTEVVLLITPRVVRNLIRPESIDTEIYSGTDAVAGMEPLRLKPTAPGAIAVAPSGTGAGGVAPGVAGRPATPNPVAPGVEVPEPSALLGEPVQLSTPASVKPGEEFAIGIKVPIPVSQGQLQVAYDWKSFTFVSANLPVQAVPGLVAVLIDADQPTNVSVELLFKAAASVQEGGGTFTVDGAQFFDESGDLVQLPAGPPATVKIGKGNGK